MIAVLLCAGYATRMYPLTEHFPKPLLPVAGTPVLEYLLAQLLRLDGLQRIHIVTNHRFISHFEQWQRAHSSPLPLILHDDGSTSNHNRRGALADLMLALNAEPQPCRTVVAAGDNIFLFDLAPLWHTFLAHHDHAVAALHEPDTDKLRHTGVLELTGDNRVVRLHEKPADPPTHYACPPLYFFQPSLWPRLAAFLNDPQNNRDAPGYFIDYLCHHEPVRALNTNGTRLDIGSLASYHAAHAILRSIPPHS